MVTQEDKNRFKMVVAKGLTTVYKYPEEESAKIVNSSSFGKSLDMAPEEQAEVFFHYSVNYWMADIITEKAIEDVIQKFNQTRFSVSFDEEKFEVKSSEETILKAVVYRGTHTFEVLKEGEQKGIRNMMIIYPDNRITQTFKISVAGTYDAVDFCKIDDLKLDFIIS
jgi:hypothetical protein